ncbi:MAG: LysR family transcriptional regulator [Dorea sp.]
MEIRILVEFLTLAREKNITKAANILHITQSALSRRLISLEEELGVKLFDRSGRGIVLTEEGKLLESHAKKIVALCKDMQEMFGEKGTLSGEIAIGCAETRSMLFLSRQMKEYQKRYPNVTFRIYTATADDVKDKLEKGTLHFGLVKEPAEMGNYEYLRVPGEDRWGIFTRNDSSLAKKEVIHPRDLVGEPLILPVRMGMKSELESWFGEYAQSMEVAALGNTFLNAVPMVKEGLGTAICYDFDISVEGMRFIPLSPPVTNGTVLIWKKEQNYLRLTAQFIKQCRE